MQTKPKGFFEKINKTNKAAATMTKKKKDGSLKLFISEMKEGLLLPIMQKN